MDELVTRYRITVPITDHEGKIHIITLAEGKTELKPTEFYLRLLREEAVDKLLKALLRRREPYAYRMQPRNPQ